MMILQNHMIIITSYLYVYIGSHILATIALPHPPSLHLLHFHGSPSFLVAGVHGVVLLEGGRQTQTMAGETVNTGRRVCNAVCVVVSHHVLADGRLNTYPLYPCIYNTKYDRHAWD